MSSYIYPTALGSLSPREAITDAVQRILIAMDENSSALFESGWAGEDVTFDFDGAVTQGLTDIRSFVLGRIGPLDTQHCLSNVRIDVKDGADAAVLTANCVAQHCPPGRGMEPNGPKLLGGSRMHVFPSAPPCASVHC